MAAVKAEPGVCADCVKWSRKYTKVEGGRTALRETVKILEKRMHKLAQDNSTLNKVPEELRPQAEREKEARTKEYDTRVALEKEIAILKLELLPLHQNRHTEAPDTNQEEVSRLRLCVSDSEKEILRLKELVEKEKSRADTALKNAEVEKTRAAEAWKVAKSEKSRAGKKKTRACTETKRDQEYKIQLDALKNETAEVQSQLILALSKYEEANIRLQAEGKETFAETKRANLEKAEAEKQKSFVGEYEKKLAEEKHHANNLSCQFDEERKKNDEMLKKINELLSSKMVESGSARIDRSIIFGYQLEVQEQNGLLNKNQADSMDAVAEMQRTLEKVNEKKMKEEISRADSLFFLLQDEIRKNRELQSKIRDLTSSQHLLVGNDVSSDMNDGVEEFKKQLEFEKQKTIKEKKRANLLKAEADFQTKLAQANENKFMEEMSRSSYLSCQLEEQKKRNNVLHKKINNLVASMDLMMGNKAPGDKDASVGKLPTRVKTEKTKSNRGENCGNSKTAKIVEQRKLIRSDGMKYLEERCQADKLTNTLQESGETVETSENQLIAHSHNEMIADAQVVEATFVSPHKSRSCYGPEVKLLKEQMKIAKPQPKRMVEKFCRSILMKELDILKQEFFQFSTRLDFLDRSLSCETKGANVSVKARHCPSLSWKERKFLGLKPSQIERECRKSLCILKKPTKHACQHSKQTLFPPFSGIKVAESTSGTDSKLELPAGGSDKDLYDSSAKNSSRASFSDRWIVHSQEKFGSPSTLPNMADGISQQLTDSRLSGDVNELMQCDKHATVSNTVVRSLSNAISGGDPARNKKRKRILSLLDSVQYAFSESKKLHVQMEENVSSLHNELRSPVARPAEGKNMARNNPYDRFDESYKKRLVFHKQKVSSQCSPLEKHFVELDTDHPGIKGETADLCTGRPATVLDNDLLNGVLVCKPSNFASSNENGYNSSECFDQITDGDYEILLDLDDHDDEKRYRVARDNMMSPSLPKIKFHRGNLISVDEVDLTVKDASNPGLSSANCSLNVADVDMNSLSLKEHSSWTAHKPLVQGDRADCFNAKECIKQGFPDMKVDGSYLEAIVSKKTRSPCETLLNDEFANFCVVHSETVDRDNLSRVFYATRRGASQCHSSSPPGKLLKRALDYINYEDLPPKDKVCVFFSVIMAGSHVAALRELVIQSESLLSSLTHIWLISFQSSTMWR